MAAYALVEMPLLWVAPNEPHGHLPEAAGHSLLRVDAFVEVGIRRLLNVNDGHNSLLMQVLMIAGGVVTPIRNYGARVQPEMQSLALAMTFGNIGESLRLAVVVR